MRILAVDVGRGTQDILLYDPREEMENAVQMVLPARTVLLAGRIQGATAAGQAVVLRGVTMGGGPVTKAARRHVESGLEVFATPEAAATFSDDPGEVAEMGVRLVDEPEAARLAARPGTLALETADVDLAALASSLGAWGLEADFAAVAVAVQDHGAPPSGVSDRSFRFAWFREALGRDPRLQAQCFTPEELPARFTRMRGVARSMDGRGPLLMDTGFAALLGACLDREVAPSRVRLLANAGNGHTLAALVEGTSVRALMEHHTRKLTPQGFSAFAAELASGRVEDEQVFSDGGHGAFHDTGPFPGAGGVEARAITGPRRERFASCTPPFRQASPFGSMMQTGCFGLLAALFLRRPGLAGEGLEQLLGPLAGGVR